MKDEQQGVKACRCVKVTCYIRDWTEGAFGWKEPFDQRFNSHFEVSIGALPTAAPQWVGFLEYPNAQLSLLYTHIDKHKYAGVLPWKPKKEGEYEDEHFEEEEAERGRGA